MTKSEYNGWYNYETWNLKLWMDNDEGTSNWWDERAQEIFDSSKESETFSKLKEAKFALAHEIEDSTDEQAQELLKKSNAEASWMADFLNAAIKEVNYHEIAEHILENVEKETTA